MAKLDHLGWVDGFAFSCYGVRIGIRANDPKAIERAREFLPPRWSPGTSPRVERLYSIILGGPSANPNVRKFNLLYFDHTRATRSRDEQTVFDDLERDLSAFVAVAARRRLFVHAGVVGWNGKAIVMPGKTLAGKTTLVAEFVKAGATYYSDEYAVFDAHGRVHPYARPLGIRENGVGDKAKKFSAAALGGVTGDKALPVGLVLVSEYKEDGKWNPRELSPGQGAMALLANTVAARVKPEVMLPTLQQVVEHAAILKSSRGEASEVVDSVLKMDLAGRA
jgi:hypothetical protein